MKTFLLIGAVLVLAAGVWLVDRGGIYPTEHRAYRFEVTVDTPEGLKTAYSVHEITMVDMRDAWGPSSARYIKVKRQGEAVPFVLSDGTILFATLLTRQSDGVGPPFFSHQWGESIRDTPEKFDVQIPEESWPRLAIIDAANKPETLRMADGRKRKATYFPAQKLVYEVDDSPDAQAIAAQFRVVDARIVSTDEKVTNKVADLLPWLMETLVSASYSSRQTTDVQLMAFILKMGVRG